MDGFQYQMYFQVEKKSGTMDVNEESLCLLPDCDEMPRMIINPGTRECLSKKDCSTVKSYYSSGDPECSKHYLANYSMIRHFQVLWLHLILRCCGES